MTTEPETALPVVAAGSASEPRLHPPPGGHEAPESSPVGPETPPLGQSQTRRAGNSAAPEGDADADAGASRVIRTIGCFADQGFSGTRKGYHLLKAYPVPEQPPTSLPPGEEQGYPMLLYQFMHAQYPEEFPSVSSARKAVRRRELLLNGAEVKNDMKVSPGDEVMSQRRTRPGLFPQGKALASMEVLWEDDYMAVVIKPPGIATHGGAGPDAPGPEGRRSVRQSLPYTLAPTDSDDSPLHRPVHAHRLDKPTGGLLVCAKTRPALAALTNSFEQRRVSKRYVALVNGRLEGSGVVVTPLDGKEAHTNYRARGEPLRSLKTPFISTVDLWPVTGRTHQLRRHLASIGCPILGDAKYTPENMALQEGEGLFLWAVGLTLPHPISGEQLKFSIPEPDKFRIWREKEHKRWLEHGQTSPKSSGEGQGGVASGAGARDGNGELENKRPGYNTVPEVEGLQFEERDGFRYYQYDWSVVGGPPTPLSAANFGAEEEGLADEEAGGGAAAAADGARSGGLDPGDG